MNILTPVPFRYRHIYCSHHLYTVERIKSHLQKFRIRSKEEFLNYYENSIVQQFQAFKKSKVGEDGTATVSRSTVPLDDLYHPSETGTVRSAGESYHDEDEDDQDEAESGKL